MENIYEVSKWLINNGRGMSNPSKNGNLKLQKLLYYSNAFSLSVYGEPLFENDIEAWVEGPVVKDAYVGYRYSELWSEKAHEISRKTEDILKFVISLYDEFTGMELKMMSHDEEPWKQYENEVEPYKQIIISSSDIKKHHEGTFKNVFESYQNEKSVKVGENIFIYNPQETELTKEDIDVLKTDFREEKDSEYFVYKENGDLVAY